MDANELLNLPGNSVVYSEQGWAAARKASHGSDMWFIDSGSHAAGTMDSLGLSRWCNDWVKLR